MDAYYIDLVLACLGDAWKKLESAKGYAIRAGVPNTQRLDKLIAGSSMAMSVYTDYLRQATEQADDLAQLRPIIEAALAMSATCKDENCKQPVCVAVRSVSPHTLKKFTR